MQKTMSKRLVSMVLAICMVIGLVPTQFMQFKAAAADGHTYSYNLYKAQYSGNRGYQPSLLTSYNMMTAGHPEELNPSIPSDPWKFAGKSETGNFAFMSTAYAFMLIGNPNDWFSIQIKVPEAGVYTPSITYGIWNLGPKMRVYIAPANAENPRDPVYAVSDFDTYEKDTTKLNWLANKAFPNKDMEAGDYIVSFEMTGVTVAPPGRFALSAINLDLVTPRALKLSAPENQLFAKGATKELALSATLNDASADLAGATGVTAASRNTGVALVAVADNKVNVTGKAIGETIIDVTVQHSGETAKIAVPVYIGKALGYTYDFTKIATSQYKGLDIKTVTSFNQTTIGNNDEINKDSKLCPYTDPWHYVGASNEDFWIPITDAITYGLMMGHEEKGCPAGAAGNGNWARFKIKVSEAGTYIPTSLSSAWKNGPVVDFYLAPEDAADPLNQDYKIGSLNSYDAGGKWDFETAFEPKNIEAGNYLLTYYYSDTKAPGGLHRFPFRAFKLAKPEVNYVSVGAAENISNRIGDTFKKPIYASVNFANVDIATIENLSVSVTNPTIASASIVDEGGKKMLVVKSLEEGKTTITLKGSAKGIDSKSVIPINVERPHYRYSFYKLQNGKTSYDIKTITDFDMMRAYSPKEINKTLGGEETDPYIYGGSSDASKFYYNSGAYGAIMTVGADNEYFAVKLEVLAKGNYRPVATYGAWTDGPIVDVYLAPENAPNPRDGNYKLGTIDTYTGTGNKWTEKKVFKDQSLDTGAYVLSYVVTGKNNDSKNKLFTTGAFELQTPPKNLLLLNVGSTTVYQGSDTKVTLGATLDDTPVNLADFTKLNITSADDQVLQIKEVGTDGFTIHGVKKGTTTVTIDAEYNGIAIKKEIPIEVRTAQFVYDYMKCGYREYGKGVDIHTVTDFAMTTMGNPKEINLNAPFCSWTDPWTFNAEENGATFKYADTTYGCMMEGPVGAVTSMKIKVPVSSVYSAFSRTGLWSQAGIINIYLAPENATNPRSSKYLLKQVDCYKSTTAVADWTTKVPLRNVTLDAGVYTLSYEVVGKNPKAGNTKFPVGAFLLEPPTSSEVYLTNDEISRVMNGGNAQTALHLDIDGVITDFTKASDVTVTSANTKIATAEIVKSDDGKNASINIAGVSNGNTTLTVTATVDGKSATLTIPILVVNPLAVDYVEVKSDKTTLKANENAQLSVNGFHMDGSPIDMSTATTYYQSSNARVATVDANGKVTARDRGTTKITAFVSIDGEMNKASIDIAVDSDATILDATITAPSSIEIGENYNLKVSGKLSGGLNYISETAAKFEVESMSPQDCIEIKDNILTGKAIGTVTIKATIPARENQPEIKVAPITIKVCEPIGPSKIVYDFRADQSTAIADATVAKNGWAINKTLTDPEVFGKNAKELRYQIYGIAVKVDGFNTQTNSDVTFDVNIPAGGAYALTVDGGNYAAGSVASIYVDKKYVGQYDFYNPGAVKIGPEATMNTLELTKGTHTVTFRRNSEKLPYFYLGSMTFNKVSNMPTYSGFELSAEQEKLSVGESCKLSAGMKMSDGSPCNAGNLYEGNAPDADNNYAVENLTPDVVAVENGRIRGLKAGQASLKVIGKCNGQVVEKTLAITIDDEKITTIEPSIEKSNLTAGESVKIKTVAKTASGRVLNPESIQITATPETNGIVSIANGVITAVGNGTTKIQVSATLNGNTVTGFVEVTVTGGAVEKLVLSAPNTSIKPTDADGQQIAVSAIDATGATIDLKDAVITYESLNTRAIFVSETGLVMPVDVGKGDVLVTVKIGDKVLTGKINFNVTFGKTQATYYTPERVAAMRENNKKYDWAREGSEAIINKAEKFIDKQDILWNLVTTQELPRGITVGYRHDPNAYLCRFCGADLRAKFGEYSWIMNPFDDEFKIQCPDCRRKFPSNDFKSFYQCGIKEDGTWSYEKAKAEGQEYLKNVLYPEQDKKYGVTGWGVDDGYGYRTGKMISANGSQQEETHTYIAYYNHWGLWYDLGNMENGGIIQQSLEVLREAYLQSGNIRYGRIGATLVDRIADVNPDMYLEPYFPRFFNSDSTTKYGKQIGCIWQHGLTRTFVKSYDAFYPMYDDPQVMSFISTKAQQIGASDKKQNPTMVRQRIEDNILRQSYKDIRSGNINGNFGMHQSCAAYIGVVLDSMPESKEIIDWIFKSSTDNVGAPEIRGGNVAAQMINLVDRDGHGSESAPNYNWLWTSNMINIADVLAGYKNYDGQNLYKNPKFMKMFKAMFPLTLSRRTTAQIGDSGRCGNNGFIQALGAVMRGYTNTKDPEMAQFIYMMNGNSVKGLHGDAMMPNPESVQQEILDVVKKYGEYDIDHSQQLAGYGFSILRDGSYYPQAMSSKTIDTQRDFWLYYGGANSHRHLDLLNLGIEAYGFNVAPELGYPEAADGAEKNTVWGQGTINHNTVMVNNQEHNKVRNNANGNPLHFDDSGRVKLMDIDGPKSATNATAGNDGIFRRTVVMVRVNDEISYGVDFFRVKGGNDHLYNFHAMSDEISEVVGLNLVQQSMGSYAGPDIKYGTSGYSNGYSWLNNVRRAAYPGSGEFAIDFKIKDFRKLLPKPMDLHLRMTMLNDFDLSEVAIASGQPPQTQENPKSLEFVLARRTGKDLDSLFTTVFEPYNGKRYIKSMSRVPMYRNGGAQPSAMDTAKAIKVELENGNVDYIVYATNNMVQYNVDNKFDFVGFVGVYTEKDGKVVYTYGNDATRIGDLEGVPAYTGKVIDFTRDFATKNSITVSFDQKVDPALLKNKFINVANGSTLNASYQILNATTTDNKNYVLDIGDLTLIKSTKDANNLDGGFNYNIAEGQTFKIPLPLVNEAAPVFYPIEDQRIEAGSELRFQVSAESISGNKLTYSANTLPNGASFDPETRIFSWRPYAGQHGVNQASFNVTDGTFTETLHVRIDVNSSTNGGGTGGGSSGGTDPVKPPVNPPVNPGGDKVKTEFNVEGKLDQDKNAVAAPSTDDITKGLNSDAEKVTITMKEAKDAAGYAVKLPTSVLVNNSMNKQVVINTPVGSAVLPTDMLANDASVVSSKNGTVNVAIAKTDAGFDVSMKLNGKDYTWKNEDTAVKISTSYTPKEDMKNADCIIIKDHDGNIIPNGKYADGSVSVYTSTLGEFAIAYNEKTFNDLDAHKWANEAVTRLAAREIINGTSTTTYAPGANITRADFTVLTVRTFGFKANGGEGFGDVDKNAYYADAVAVAQELGIVGGSAGKFNPKAQISREDMMVIIARAIEKSGRTLSGNEKAQFTDANQVSGYATDAVNKLTASGLVAGSNSKINPKGKTTRAEIAVLLDRLVFAN